MLAPLILGYLSQIQTSAYATISDPKLKPFFDFISLLMLALTVVAGFLSIRATSSANELQLLPFIAIYLREKGAKTNLRIRNMGVGVAYDVRISRYFRIITDAHLVWEMRLHLEGTNVLAKEKDEQDLSSEAFQNGKRADIDDFLLAAMKPRKDSKLSPIDFDICFKNARGEQYYTIIQTGKDGVKILVPTKKLNVFGRLRLIWRRVNTYNTLVFYMFVWKFTNSKFK